MDIGLPNKSVERMGMSRSAQINRDVSGGSSPSLTFFVSQFMTRCLSLRPIVVAMIVLLGSSSYAAEQTNRDLTLRIEPIPRYPAYSLFVSGQRATNFVLESSVDLRGWQTVYQ